MTLAFPGDCLDLVAPQRGHVRGTVAGPFVDRAELKLLASYSTSSLVVPPAIGNGRLMLPPAAAQPDVGASWAMEQGGPWSTLRDAKPPGRPVPSGGTPPSSPRPPSPPG